MTALDQKGGKSGLHGNTVPGNARRGRPQGKCHREQTASRYVKSGARVKGCGKSAPRAWRQGRHGKPHREQDQIGMAEASRLMRVSAQPSGSVARGVWRQAPQMNGHPRDAWRRRPGQNPAYRPAGPLDCSRAGLFAGGNEMNIQNGSPNMETAKDCAFQDVERVDASTGARRSTVLRPP